MDFFFLTINHQGVHERLNNLDWLERRKLGKKIRLITFECGRTKAVDHSHKIFRVFTQGHVNDVQSVVVMLLR